MSSVPNEKRALKRGAVGAAAKEAAANVMLSPSAKEKKLAAGGKKSPASAPGKDPENKTANKNITEADKIKVSKFIYNKTEVICIFLIQSFFELEDTCAANLDAEKHKKEFDAARKTLISSIETIGKIQNVCC